MSDLVNINIDGKPCAVPAGLNVIEAAKLAGVEIPHFCYHPNLQVAGSCRLCLVSIGTPARDRATGEPVLNPDGTQKIAFMPKLAISCGTKVSEGMHVVTNSPQVKAAREGVLEFLLLNHPLDCPICDKAGECKLQEYSENFGRGRSRYVEEKNAKPKKVPVAGGRIMLDAERCVLCSRCIRFCREIIGRDIFGFIRRGSKNEISVYGDDGGDSNYIMNVVDGCPVGALTEAAFRFKMRPWFMRVVNGVAPESSAGVNTNVWVRENTIYRITPRANPFVNDSWTSDSSRYEYKIVNSDLRLRRMRVDGAPCEPGYALSRAVDVLKSDPRIAVVASARQPLEEQFLLAEFASMAGAKVYAVSHLGEDDGFLVSADRTPNMRGLFVSGLIKEYPKPDLSGLAAEIRMGNIKTVLCLCEDATSLGLEEKDFKLANFVYCGVNDSLTARLAKVALAISSNFEHAGLFINRQFRLQKFDKAVCAPKGVLDFSAIAVKFINAFGASLAENPDIGQLRMRISEMCPILPKGCETGEGGVVIDSSAFASIKFPETKSLHFLDNE